MGSVAWVVIYFWFALHLLLLFHSGCASANRAASASTRPAAVSQRTDFSAEAIETFQAAWETIRDSHYDPTFGGLDWNQVRLEYLPQAALTRNREELREVLSEMLRTLGISHMAIIPGEVAAAVKEAETSLSASDSPGATAGDGQRTSGLGSKADGSAASDRRGETAATGHGDLGFEVRLLNNQLVVTRVDPSGPAARAGVREGWAVRRVGKQSIADLLAELDPKAGLQHREVMAWRLTQPIFRGHPGSKVEVEFVPGGPSKAVSLVLERRHPPGDLTQLGLLPPMYARFEQEELKTRRGMPVGVIRFNVWMIPIARPFDRAIDQFRRHAGIIIDLRGNIGGIGGMILGLSGHFLNDRVSLGTMKMRDNELHFYTNPRRVSADGERVEPYDGPVAILTDRLSLSAAEIFAGGMQVVGRARVFGEQSGGQALPAAWTKLPNGDILYHALADFILPDGTRLEGRGVIPDEVTPVTRENLLAGRDVALEAALNWIDRQNQ